MREAVRPVEHFSYFRNEGDLAVYEGILKVSGMKFRRTKEGLGIIATVHSGSADKVINEQIRLFRRATELFGGEYDGWETELVSQVPKKD